MNEYLKMLYDEHAVIVSTIDSVRDLDRLVSNDPSRYEKLARKIIDFLRGYADRFHHYKEEIILFPEMVKQNELLGVGIIHEMLDNHEDFREMIAQIEKKMSSGEYAEAQKKLVAYSEALLDHIAVENEEVFQIAADLFTDDELERIYHRFLDCDSGLGNAKKEEWLELSHEIRNEIYLKVG